MTLLLAIACSSEPEYAAPTPVQPAAQPGAGAPGQPPADGAPPLADASLAGAMSLDPGTSKVGFHASKITGSHDGEFKGVSGTATIDGGMLVMMSGEVELASVQTDSKKLDNHLMGEEFFDVAKFPKASFESTSIAQGDGGYTITGDLAMHGVSSEISFPATVSVGAQAVEIDAQVTIDRQVWGVSYPGKPDDLIQDEVALTLDLNFTSGG